MDFGRLGKVQMGDQRIKAGRLNLLRWREDQGMQCDSAQPSDRKVLIAPMCFHLRIEFGLLVFTLHALTSVAVGGQCVGQWSEGFTLPGVVGRVYAMTEFDDGRGPGIIVGGLFDEAAGIDVANIARWDGLGWSRLSEGIFGPVWALLPFNDGSGLKLYAGGDFDMAGNLPAGNVARWNGAEWEPVGTGMIGRVYALEIYDDGTGPALYAAGNFYTAGGVNVKNIARWNGAQWESIGGGSNGVIYSLAAKTFWTNHTLCMGGQFSTVGGESAMNVGFWNGQEWGNVGGGIDDTVKSLRTIASNLFATGDFEMAGRNEARGIARISLGQWFGTFIRPSDTVNDIAEFAHGSTTSQFVVGDFTYFGDFTLPGSPMLYISEIISSHGYPVGGGLENKASVVEVLDDGSGTALYVGGEFVAAGSVAASGIARWNGQAWSSLGHGNGIGGVAVYDLLVAEDEQGSTLYAAGEFAAAGATLAHNIARWDGAEWSTVGDVIFNDGPGYHRRPPRVYDLALFDDGSGRALYVGGNLYRVNGEYAGGIVRWNGEKWQQVGGGTNGWVRALVAFDDGTGEALYAAGTFTEAGSAAMSRIARWDGVNWSPLGTGMDSDVNTLSVYDDGTGPALYAGGYFSVAGGIAANHVAHWDGHTWSPLSTGTDGPVRALAGYDDGTGPELYAGGQFLVAGGINANFIARWNGQQWEALGVGTSGIVNALTIHEDACGKALYVGGYFEEVGGVKANGLGRWNAQGWASLAESDSTSGHVHALASFDDGGGPALYIGGTFSSRGGIFSNNVARWECVIDETNAGDCDGNSHVDWSDIATLTNCLRGPELNSEELCACSDVDCDADVDLRDFSFVQRQFDGP